MRYFDQLFSIHGEGDGFFKSLFSFLKHLTTGAPPETLTSSSYYLFCKSWLDLSPLVYLQVVRMEHLRLLLQGKSVMKPPGERCLFTHQIHWGKQSSEEEKLHCKFSDGKQASFWDPGHSSLIETCCQCHIKGSICCSAPWQAWERLHHPLLWGAAKSQYL